jgi:hypothetical protein
MQVREVFGINQASGLRVTPPNIVALVFFQKPNSLGDLQTGLKPFF